MPAETKIADKKRKRFISDSWDIISSSQKILKLRLHSALEYEKEIDSLLALLVEIKDEELSREEKKKILKNLASMKLADAGKLSSILSASYDKMSLAEGKATMNLFGEINTTVKRFEDL